MDKIKLKIGKFKKKLRVFQFLTSLKYDELLKKLKLMGGRKNIYQIF